MKAIILAAGRGSRMNELTQDRPKCLVEFQGKALLDHQCRALSEGGVEEIAVVTGYRAEMLEARQGKTFHNARWADTNMVMSLACAAEWLHADPCIVSYADIFYAPQTVSRLRDVDDDIAITYDPNWLNLWSRRFENPLEDAETFRMDEQGYLTEIGKRPRTADEVEGQYMGLLKFTPQGWGKVEQCIADLADGERDTLDMTGLLGRLIAAGVRIRAVPAVGDWGEVDHRSDIELYDTLIRDGDMSAPYLGS